MSTHRNEYHPLASVRPTHRTRDRLTTSKLTGFEITNCDEKPKIRQKSVPSSPIKRVASIAHISNLSRGACNAKRENGSAKIKPQIIINVRHVLRKRCKSVETHQQFGIQCGQCFLYHCICFDAKLCEHVYQLWQLAELFACRLSSRCIQLLCGCLCGVRQPKDNRSQCVRRLLTHCIRKKAMVQRLPLRANWTKMLLRCICVLGTDFHRFRWKLCHRFVTQHHLWPFQGSSGSNQMVHAVPNDVSCIFYKVKCKPIEINKSFSIYAAYCGVAQRLRAIWSIW